MKSPVRLGAKYLAPTSIIILVLIVAALSLRQPKVSASPPPPDVPDFTGKTSTVVFDQPQGNSHRTVEVTVPQEGWQILVDNKVAAYVCGHEHIYGRQSVDGVYQIVAGSAGAPLYEFNPKFSEQPDSIKPYEEMSYNEAVPYYKVLNYNYGPGKNGQRSEDFFGLRAFHYAIFNVKEDKVEVKIYGAFPKEKISHEMNNEIKLIDKFEIND